MKTVNRKNRLAAGILCLAMALCFPALAARAVEPAKKCAMTVRIAADKLPADMDAEYADQVYITTSLYKVADVDKDYRFTAVGDFTDAGFQLAGYTDKSVEEINALAEKAQAAVAEKAIAPDAEARFHVNGSGVLGRDENGAASLDTGLYLMLSSAEDPKGYYSYTFSPVLLSLPSMDPLTGEDMYELPDVELKCEVDPAKVKLEIEKTLLTYSTMQGPATFVFQVEAAMNGLTVYSDVRSMVFTEAGVKQLIVDDLPMGAEVTVTEVYSGACYSPTGAGPVQIVTIAPTENDEPLKVAFTNDYNEEHKNGSSITNSFAYDEDNWTWTQLTDNTATAE